MGETESGREKDKSLQHILQQHKSLIGGIGPDAAEKLRVVLARADKAISAIPPGMGSDALEAWEGMSERELVRVSGMPARYRGKEFARTLSAMGFLAGKLTGAETGQWIEITKKCLHPADLVDSIAGQLSTRPEQLVVRPSARDDGTVSGLIARFNDNQEDLPYWLQEFFLSIPETWFKEISRDDLAEYFYSSRSHPLDPMGKLNEVLAPMGLAMYPIVRGKTVERLRLARVWHTVTSGNGEFLKGYATNDEGLIKDADGYFDPVLSRIYVRGGETFTIDARHAYLHERQHLFDFLTGYSAKVNKMESMEKKTAFIEATAYARDSISRLENGESVSQVSRRLGSISRKNGIEQPFKELMELAGSAGPDRKIAAIALRDCIDGKYFEVLGISFSGIFGSVL